MSASFTLQKLKNTSFFEDLYVKLFSSQKLSYAESLSLLKISIALLKSENKELKGLGYRIILLHSNKTNEYTPLFDVSINLGYFPVVKLIKRDNKGDSFWDAFQESVIDVYKTDDYMSTFEQFYVRKSFNIKEKSFAVIAPTSYGKSELIEQTINIEGNVCILVPTKALLAQTKRRLLTQPLLSKKSFITHPDMELPPNNQGIIAILTQERLIRFFQTHKDLFFDMAFIDEAHNLLDDSDRSRLLAAAIAMIKKRNEGVSFAFLTPFVKEIENLKILNTVLNLQELRITEKIKTEKLFMYDFKKLKKLMLYDQFFNKFIRVSEKTYSSYAALIKDKSGSKNIVYLNKPLDAQKYALILARTMGKSVSKDLKKCIDDLEEITHKDYDLLYCLERGVVYHHGSMPDRIKLFVENLYSNMKSIKYIVTTSTLLEGVNIPAEKLFVLDNRKGRRKLSPAQFKNLLGRICRFSEVFHRESGRLDMLEPEIFVLRTEYSRADANLSTFLEETMKINKKINDNPENILLEHTKETEDLNRKLKDYSEFINNIEPGIVNGHEYRRPKTSFGEECFKNNIFEIDIIDVEKDCVDKIEQLKKCGIILSDPVKIMEAINNIFLTKIREDEDERGRNLGRLKKLGAQNFYAMLLKWRISHTKMHQMIWSFVSYWNELVRTEEHPYVYVGKWGEEEREGFLPRWVDISSKTNAEKINLAIVRIKDEQDFLDNTLMKFIEVLKTSTILDEDVFLKIKYGTTDQFKINLSKGGMSLSLISLIVEKYDDCIVKNVTTNQITFKPEVLDKMKSKSENEVIRFEASFHTRK